MSVLVLAPVDDEHAVAVAEEIRRRGGEVDVVDLAHFPELASVTMRFECCAGCRRAHLQVGSGTIALDRVGAVWSRRPHHPAVTEAMVRPSHRAFAANETHEALGGVWPMLDAGWINDPAADDRAQHKGFQLGVAQDLGLEIPNTLMTNDPDEALRFVDALGYRDVVYKTFSSTQDEWRETRLLRDDELELLPLVRHAPVIFQRYVPARFDIRATVVGDQVLAAAIHSQDTDYPVDSRIDIGHARIEPIELGPELVTSLLDLTGRLGLVYGAIDLRRTPDGIDVFLEINPAGQFLYIEAATGLAITSAMAEALLALDRAHQPVPA